MSCCVSFSSVKDLRLLAVSLVLTTSLVFPIVAKAAETGEVIQTPVPFMTYVLTTGKLTGKEFVFEKNSCREFRFDQDLPYNKPKETRMLGFSLRGGYRAHDVFGHDDFVPQNATEVATGWVPVANGNFLIWPDKTKEHLPCFIPDRTKLVSVPYIKQCGSREVNAYDLALALDRVNKGEGGSIPFRITPSSTDTGAVYLIPVQSLPTGVYYAYSLSDDTQQYPGVVNGFLFAVGSPVSGLITMSASNADSAKNEASKVDSKLAREVLDYALLSQAVYSSKYSPIDGWQELPSKAPLKISFTDIAASPSVSAQVNNTTALSTPPYADIETGFFGRAFKKSNEIIIAFRGTEITELGDLKADVQNFSNAKPEQYQQALDFVAGVLNDVPPGVDKITLTGHSLGGGLASYAALYFGANAVVFNGAGLGQGLRANIPQQHMERQQSLVRNIDLKSDPVTALGGQVGSVYQLDLPSGMIDPASYMGTGPIVAIEPHFMDGVISALQVLIK